MIIWHLKMCLKIIGVWEGTRPSIIVFIMIGSLAFSLVFQIMNLKLVINELDLLMSNLNALGPVTCAMLKLAVFQSKFRSIKIVLRELRQDWKCYSDLEREVMLKNYKITYYLCNSVAIAYHLVIIVYLIITLVSYTDEDINNRHFLIQADFPIEGSKRSPIFELLCLLQFPAFMFSVNSHSLIEELLITSVLHSNTKAFAVCQEISRFSEVCQSDGESRERVLRAKEKLMAKHLNFITFTNCIQDIYTYISFFHVFLITLVNCSVVYTLMTLISLSGVHRDNLSTFLMCIVYTTSLLVGVATYCIAGEFLTTQSNSIFNGFCDVPWYNFKCVDIRLLVFMTMRSSKPAYITVGNVGSLSHDYFTSIIKATASYLSFIRASGNQ